MSAPPLPSRANLHVALALALGARAQESDAQLIERVRELRRLAETPRDGLFSFVDEDVPA